MVSHFFPQRTSKNIQISAHTMTSFQRSTSQKIALISTVIAFFLFFFCAMICSSLNQKILISHHKKEAFHQIIIIDFQFILIQFHFIYKHLKSLSNMPNDCVQVNKFSVCLLVIYLSFQSPDMQMWQNDYLQGTGCEMYTETLSPSFTGMTFPQACE